MSQPRFKLTYWPIAFRGCFISYMFGYCDVPVLREDDMDAIIRLKTMPLPEQDVPFMGPPVLQDLRDGKTISQAPAIALYASGILGLQPADAFETAMCLKVQMDCNDVLMELCRFNGSMMWDCETWTNFRSASPKNWFYTATAQAIRNSSAPS